MVRYYKGVIASCTISTYRVLIVVEMEAQVYMFVLGLLQSLSFALHAIPSTLISMIACQQQPHGGQA